ncbi:MAG: methyltransferase domain-containing protein [Candidatus Portnoybacteria bacterium]|nr:methyltransferase domain-containing protein [Candidatus Portnoybacteria bacterium]
MAFGTGGFLHPEEIIKQLNIQADSEVADFGCGAGYFSLPLAKMVHQGKVYSLDILDTALESVRSRAKLKGLFNIETKRCNLEKERGSGLEDESMDLVLLANILFQSSNKKDIIKEAVRVLKKDGCLALIDWKPNQPMGPPEDMIIPLEEIKGVVEEQGLKEEKELPIDKYHWGVVFIK